MEEIIQDRMRNWYILLLMVMIFGFISVWFGQDASWDFKNYHWYNAYSFINDRMDRDIAPSQVQTYYNPILDLLTYSIHKVSPSPAISAFVLGSLYGLSVFILVKIAILFINLVSGASRFWICISVTIGVTGTAVVRQIGLSSHECLLSIFTMSALFIILKTTTVNSNKAGFCMICLAGLLSGLSAGAKLDHCIYSIGFLAALIFKEKPSRQWFKEVFLFCIFCVIGFFITNGFWMVRMWKLFDSPLFPFYNAYFKSPFWEPVNFFDRRYIPMDWKKYLFFPLYWIKLNKTAGEQLTRDFRFACVMILSIFFVFRKWRIKTCHSWKEMHPNHEQRKRNRILLIFFIISYCIWIHMFSIYRYLVPLEMLTGIIVVCLSQRLFGTGLRSKVVVSLMAVIILTTTVYGNLFRRPFGPEYLEISAPKIPDNSLVILLGGSPMSFVIPGFNEKAIFVRPFSNFMRPERTNLLQKKINSVINNFTGEIYALEDPTERKTNATNDNVLDHFKLNRVPETCSKVTSNIGSPLNLWRLARDDS